MPEIKSQVFVGDPAEMAQASRLYWQDTTKNGVLQLLANGLLLLGLSALSWWTALHRTVAIGILILGVEQVVRAFTVNATLNQRFVKLYSARRTSDLMGPQEMVLTDEGLTNSMETGSRTFIPWKLFHSLKVTDQSVIVHSNGHIFNVPRRAFAEPDWVAVVEFVRSKVAEQPA